MKHCLQLVGGRYSFAVVAVHLLKLCCSLCYRPKYLQHAAFIVLISTLCCPSSRAPAIWISISYTFMRTSCRELKWVWNRADYCRWRQFWVHVILIINTWHRWHFTINVRNIDICIVCILCHCIRLSNIYIYSFTIRIVKFYPSVN